MQMINYIYLTNSMSLLYYMLVGFLFVSIFLNFIFMFKYKNKQILYNMFNNLFIMRIFLLFSFLISIMLMSTLMFYYLNYLYFLFKNNLLNDNLMNYVNKLFFFYSINLSIDFFGLMLCSLAFIVGFISFLALDSSIYWKNMKFLSMCNILILTVMLYTSINNVILLFIFYEALLIPSFLFVYYVSPYSRSIQASLYFLMWTQLGSLFVLIAVVYMYMTTKLSNFVQLQNFLFTSVENYLLFYLLFLGFGMKIPMWPFHHWLTKTHVEAPAGFSMFLSGFLVKSALYGFYKMSFFLNFNINISIAICMLLFSVMDASLKMWGQTDLKKLIAFGTMQEMNLMYLLFCWGDCNAMWGGMLFCMTHSFLSGLFFYTVDCMQSRFHTSNMMELSGVLYSHPNLGVLIFMNCIFYSGLPGTLKFMCELYLYNGLVENSFLLGLFLFMICNYLGLMGFCKCWYNILFGLPLKSKQIMSIDINIKEFLIIFMCYFNLVFLVFIDNYFLH